MEHGSDTPLVEEMDTMFRLQEGEDRSGTNLGSSTPVPYVALAFGQA